VAISASSLSSSSIDQLVSMYMAVESQPLDELKTQRDELSVRSGLFTDLKGQINDLKTASEALTSTDEPAFGAHKVTSSDEDVATATGDSTATNGSFEIEVTKLAKAHRMKSTVGTGWKAGADGSFTVNGALITVTQDQTLYDIRNSINKATYASGKEVVASLIDGKLVLESKNSGTAYSIDFTGASSGTVLADLGMTNLQAATDAEFSVNGISMTRAKNSGLDDVVSGLTVNLGTLGKSTLTVADDTTTTRTKIDTFLSKLNGLVDYLNVKSAVTKEADGSYSRGPLNDYSLYTDLTSGLSLDMSIQLGGVASGLPSRLYDIGITMDSNMHFVVSDSDKLNDALKDNPTAVGNLFTGSSGVAQKIIDRVTPYVVDPVGPAKSFLDAEQDSIDSETRSINDSIKDMNERLAQTEENYRSQFTQLQAALIEAQQLQAQMTSLFSSTSSLY
jgi:flagellar hook-associated protein 2